MLISYTRFGNNGFQIWICINISSAFHFTFWPKIKLKVTQSFLRDYVGLKGYLKRVYQTFILVPFRNVSLCTHASKLGGGSKNYTTNRKSSLIKSWGMLNCWLYRKCMPSYYAVAAVMFLALFMTGRHANIGDCWALVIAALIFIKKSGLCSQFSLRMWS